MEKLFHPSIYVVRVQEIEPEMLELAAVFLHDLGWLTQQGNFEGAAERLKFYAEQKPELFLKACATGFAAIRQMLD